MARVVKKAEVRQDELLDVAQGMFLTQGYDTTSVQAIIDAVGIAKGTFYHHYPSKAAVLDAIIVRMTAQSLELVQPLVDDPTQNAIEKLNGLFLRIGAWKAEHRALLTEMHRALHQPANALLLTQMQQRSMAVVSPVVARILEQGVAEGVFDTPYPKQAARVLLELGISMGRGIGDALLHDGPAPSAVEIAKGLHAYHDAVQRLLGAPKGAIHLVDVDAVLVWFKELESR